MIFTIRIGGRTTRAALTRQVGRDPTVDNRICQSLAFADVHGRNAVARLLQPGHAPVPSSHQGVCQLMPSQTLRPLIVGEILFDCFPSHRVLGGAPLNVAWNLRRLGCDPLLVSAVGADEHGDEVRQALRTVGLDPAALQVLTDYATGRVDIELVGGEPRYRFWDDVAFDHIGMPAPVLADQAWGLLYHGSLALRGQESRRTVEELRRRRDCPLFIDVNIRRPHFDPAWVESILAGAEHVKLNREELLELAVPLTGAAPATDLPQASVAADASAWEQDRRRGELLRDRFGIDNLWITAGAAGAAWLGPGDQFLTVAAPPVANLVDTVGAGDAFAATIIRGILSGQTPDESLAAAAAFASRVCAIRGATTDQQEFYAAAMGDDR